MDLWSHKLLSTFNMDTRIMNLSDGDVHLRELTTAAVCHLVDAIGKIRDSAYIRMIQTKVKVR